MQQRDPRSSRQGKTRKNLRISSQKEIKSQQKANSLCFFQKILQQIGRSPMMTNFKNTLKRLQQKIHQTKVKGLLRRASALLELKGQYEELLKFAIEDERQINQISQTLNNIQLEPALEAGKIIQLVEQKIIKLESQNSAYFSLICEGMKESINAHPVDPFRETTNEILQAKRNQLRNVAMKVLLSTLYSGTDFPACQKNHPVCDIHIRFIQNTNHIANIEGQLTRLAQQEEKMINQESVERKRIYQRIQESYQDALQYLQFSQEVKQFQEECSLAYSQGILLEEKRNYQATILNLKQQNHGYEENMCKHTTKFINDHEEIMI